MESPTRESRDSQPLDLVFRGRMSGSATTLESMKYIHSFGTSQTLSEKHDIEVVGPPGKPGPELPIVIRLPF